MKNEVNRSFMDKKKNYNQPNVELVQLMPTTMILAGSQTGLGIGDPISGGEGG